MMEEAVAADASTSVSFSESQYNQRNNDEFELLDSVYYSAIKGDIEVFKQHEKEIKQILTPNGNTILHLYIINRSRRETEQDIRSDDFLRAIVEMCPDLAWQTNKEGETLLHFAARYGHADIVRFLLQECKKRYQDVESEIEPTRLMLEMLNEAKDTALHEAVRYNHLEVVKVLIKEGSDLVYKANSALETPLYLAAERGFTEVVEEILKGFVSPADGGPNGRTALHAAVILNDKEITEMLLGKETLSNTRQDQGGWTPLHYAAHLGNIEILEMLLNKDRHAAYMTDTEGKTPLHVAAAAPGNVKIIQKILDICPGCSELVDNRSWNALHFASTVDGTDAVDFLLSRDCIRNLVNAKDKNGDTPLLLAAKMGNSWDFYFSKKVDQQVFNFQNHNAADIISSKSSKLFSLDSFLRKVCHHILKSSKMTAGMRTSLSLNEANKEEEEEIMEDRSSKHGSRIIDSNLLAATLISTVSFTAGVTVPGGFVSDKGPKQGTALLTGDGAFEAFVVFNTMSFLSSSLAVFFHLYESKNSQKTIKHTIGLTVGRYLTILAMMGMIGAFVCGSWAVLHGLEQYLAVSASFVVAAFFLVLICFYNFESIFFTLTKKLFAPSKNKGNKKM